MTADDAPEFHRLLHAVLETFGARPPGDAVLRLWWRALERYPWAAVAAALDAHVGRCKFAPRPSDVRERIEAGDGRPGPDEAWSLALGARDEARTLVWTDEIAAAWGLAQPVLAAGDLIGARKTFLEAYRKRIDQAREGLEPVRWRASLGTDPAQRADALQEAERRGQLPTAQVRKLIPASPAPSAAGQEIMAALATAKRVGVGRSSDADEPAGAGAATNPCGAAQNPDIARLLNALREGLARDRGAPGAQPPCSG